ncbi:MAG: hypothetical protein ACJ8EW_04400 [Rhizobium sp.]|uniref:hypothetical protein n=1 Tax=Rhizobium sp. TaxID=391 RepID=UPI003899D2B5
MSTVLGHIGVALIIGDFIFCAAIALVTSGLSGKIRHEEEAGVYRSRKPANQN